MATKTWKNSVLGEEARKTVGRTLRQARGRAGLSLKAATKRIFRGHGSADRLGRIESGKDFASVTVLLDAAKAYDISPFQLCVDAGYIWELLRVLEELRKRGDVVCAKHGLRLHTLHGLVRADGRLRDANFDPGSLRDEFRFAEPNFVGDDNPLNWGVPAETATAIFLAVYIFPYRGEHHKADGAKWFWERWETEIVPYIDSVLGFQRIATGRPHLPPLLERAARLLTDRDLEADYRGFPASELIRSWACKVSDRYSFYAKIVLYGITNDVASRVASDELPVAPQEHVADEMVTP